ncbi:MAG: DNA recombination protein RmuC [Bryobacterales bacterium]|nr:DNA recombination protein RmuC [Bryobacterales bacterium]
MTDQLLLFFGLVAAFVAGAAVVWLILRKSGEGNLKVAENVREGLQQIEQKLHAFEKDRESSQAGLKEQIRLLASSELQLQKETARLASALRSPGVRGRWGEMQLRRVAELAGLTERCDFTEQVTTNGESKQRPDLLVHLPGGRSLVVDAKVPLSAYLEANEATDEAARAAKMKEHAAQVRAQIVRLSAKSYWDQFAEAPEFVVLFLPGEAFFSAALTEEPELLEYAADRKVILATPTTLIALMKAVAYGWRQQRAAERAEEIREQGTELYERLRGMASEMAVLGAQLERAVNSYNRVLGAWETRAIPAARRMHDLGAGSGDAIDAPRPIDTAAKAPKY